MQGLADVMHQIIQVYASTGTPHYKWKRLRTALDENAVLDHYHFYTTYLLLLMDGERVMDYEESDVMGMMQDSEIQKAVYVGQTRNKWIRDSHFTDEDSSIYRALTRTSRLYFIRKEKFPTFQKAAEDEAIVIVSLMCNIENKIILTPQLTKLVSNLINRKY